MHVVYKLLAEDAVSAEDVSYVKLCEKEWDIIFRYVGYCRCAYGFRARMVAPWASGATVV